MPCNIVRSEKVPKSDIRQYFADFTGDHRSLRD
uniref:Uncharacterized protein n=1 Tax=Parascaris equorum TaxID=6256 RepID=A0A914RP52_PAREQ